MLLSDHLFLHSGADGGEIRLNYRRIPFSSEWRKTAYIVLFAGRHPFLLLFRIMDRVLENEILKEAKNAQK